MPSGQGIKEFIELAAERTTIPLDKDFFWCDALSGFETSLNNERISNSQESAAYRLLDGIITGDIPVMLLYVFNAERRLAVCIPILDPELTTVTNAGKAVNVLDTSSDRLDIVSFKVSLLINSPKVPDAFVFPNAIVVGKNTKRESSEVVIGHLYREQAVHLHPNLPQLITAIGSAQAVEIAQ